ncbi:MAG: PLP-dependent transferase [Fibrobacter sp.]|nr:PLP-dependent transferase [Fibrobacter sp.]
MSRCIDTDCIHLNETRPSKEIKHYGSLSFPIYQTATFAHPAVGESTGFDYSRLQNPTREQLEKIVASLEHGTDAIALSSGMAAIALLFEIFEPGDHIITDSDLYGGSIRLFNNVSKKNALEITNIELAHENIEKFITPKTKAIYIETPTNPMMNIYDIEKLSQIAKKHGLYFIVDNTFLSPYFQNPLDLGADVVIHSGTKYLGGHNDTIAGFVITNNATIQEKLRFLIKTTGAGLAPFDSWLILRGIKTLGIRMDRAQENAKQIAEFLLNEKDVTEVIYPGLPTHPGHAIMKKQARGFGAMLTFKVSSKDFALSILKKVSLIQFAESLGGVETLLTYPITQTHADVPSDVLARNGITDTTLRLSVGIENAKDLIQELKDVFQKIREERPCPNAI